MMKTVLRILLALTNGFLALTAIAGGIGLLTDLNAPPVSSLAGSPFRDFTIPGLALLVVVGGTAVFAALLRQGTALWQSTPLPWPGQGS